MADTPKHFKDMTMNQLRQFIEGCHRTRDYDCQFDAAVLEMSTRLDQFPYMPIDDETEG